MATECVFCAVVAGGGNAAMVLDTEDVVAFLDRAPVFPGHTLVVPRRHHETMLDTPSALLAAVFGTARRVAAAIETGLGAHGTFVAVNNRVSQSVPHLHVHVVPRHRKDGLRGFFWPRQRYGGTGEAEALASRIAAALPPPD